MHITPTINFGGNCREAIQLYEKAFEGKITCLLTYREAFLLISMEYVGGL